jgi:hypothetical protein
MARSLSTRPSPKASRGEPKPRRPIGSAIQLQPLVTEVLHIRSALPLLAFGALGAGISVASLLLSSTNGSPSAVGRLIAEPLPNVDFVAAAGFGVGALVAVVWSLASRLLAQAPST